MLDQLTDLLHAAVTSPWVYLALFAIAALDGFFPLVPGETLVITAGVFAASGGQPKLAWVVVAAALGAFVGDHVSYLLGMTAGGRLVPRIPSRSRGRTPFDRARHALAERGGLVLVICRYVPGFRTAATITLGALRYPRGAFAVFDAIAAGSWAAYSALIGFLGGVAFEQDPLRGVLLGLGIALSITVSVEAVRYLRRRTATTPEQDNETVPRDRAGQ